MPAGESAVGRPALVRLVGQNARVTAANAAGNPAGPRWAAGHDSSPAVTRLVGRNARVAAANAEGVHTAGPR